MLCAEKHHFNLYICEWWSSNEGIRRRTTEVIADMHIKNKIPPKTRRNKSRPLPQKLGHYGENIS